MKIAFISYEFPPDTGFGGIGTYTYQVSLALAAKGHTVEVFSCSRETDSMNTIVEGLVNLHRVKANKRFVFAERIVEVFRQRNELVHFDILESPEFCAEGLEVRKAFPNIPMVVKLHTPIYLVNKLNNIYKPLSFKKKIKKMIGRSSYNKYADTDYQLATMADAVCSPSVALAEIIRKEWQINAIDVVPYFFKPAPGYSAINIEDSKKNIVAFTGRLEVRKGIVSLINAIPLVLKKNPGIIFRFIGGSGEAPDGSGSMEAYIKQQLAPWINNLEFTGFIQRNVMPEHIKDVTIFVFPSIWENFPCVCLEAMSAGKAVVASDAGGMKEMLEADKGGVMVNAKEPKQLAHAISSLLNDDAKRVAMAKHNRERINDFYASAVLDIIEAYYSKVIAGKTKVKAATLPA